MFLRSHDVIEKHGSNMHEQGCEKVHARDQWDQINGQGEVWELTGGGWALMRAAVHSLEEPSTDTENGRLSLKKPFILAPKS